MDHRVLYDFLDMHTNVGSKSCLFFFAMIVLNMLFDYMRIIQNVLSFIHKKRAMGEHFCCGNTLILLVKLEKLFQISVLISVHVRQVVCNKSKNEQNNGPSSPKIFAKERHGTQENPWGHDTDTWWEVRFLSNCGLQNSRGAGIAQLTLDQLVQKPKPLMNKFMSFTVWQTSHSPADS